MNVFHAPSVAAAPLEHHERITLLDSLRGIAVLGILMMNITGFGFPPQASSNPLIFNEIGTWNYKVWYFIDWFLEGSQRALFSMLFGCGLMLFIARLEKRAEGVQMVDLYLRRHLWLLVFGLANAFILLWYWDILYWYAVLGILLFPFRKLPTKHLIAAAVVCLLLQTARENRDLYVQKAVIAKGEAIAKIDTICTKLTEEQKEQMSAMQDLKDKAKIENQKKAAAKYVKKMQGDYGEIYTLRSEQSVWGETTFLYYTLWDVLVFIFLGMAFYRLGIMQGERQMSLYAWLAIGGLALGLPISYLRLEPMIGRHFNEFEYIKSITVEFYELSRSLRAIGFFGIIMVVYKSEWFRFLFSLLQPVGQMAFSNYLIQSLLGGFIFYGVGFGLFGKLQRYELYYIVFGVWVLQIAFSNLWMRYYHFGPLEWLWRSITYGVKQAFLKKRGAESQRVYYRF